MSWFKEIYTLGKMLFTKPVLTDKMEVVRMDHFPFKGYSAMSWCGQCIVRNDYNKSINSTTLKHEQIHLQQGVREGSWIKFYLKYVWEWVKGNPIIAPASSAYRTIPYEVEAYANDDNPNYVILPVKSFKIVNRKNTYKKNRDNWEQYLKDNYGQKRI